MKFDLTLLHHDLAQMPQVARMADELGFAGLWLAETKSDPFLALTLAAEHSKRMELGTAIAVAFSRSPTLTAYIAWQLAQYAQGRFVLGLGTQVKAHNVLRFGVKWEKPIKKMRETIAAIRACWDCWQEGRPLDFVGEFFKLQLMTPFFNPGPHAYPDIPIYVSAVNAQMLRLAGGYADGVHIHPMHSVAYLREFALPELHQGLARHGRARRDLTLSASLFVIPQDGARPVAEVEAFVRQQLAFYMSTPAYKVVLELHGWGELSRRLGQLARAGAWAQMADEITDEVMETCVVFGNWADLPQLVRARYGDLVDRVNFYLPFAPGTDDAGWRAAASGFWGPAR